MKKNILLSFMICCSLCLIGQELKKREIIERMAYYKECLTETEKQEIRDCTKNKVLEFIAENLKYPEGLSKKNYSGYTFLSYAVNENGRIDASETKVLMGFGGENGHLFDQQAIKVINSLPPMVPATYKGKCVPIDYTIPVKFGD